MAEEKFPYTCVKPARLLYSSVTQASAPKGMENVEPKYSGTFGIEKEDLDAIVKLEVEAIRSATGNFTGPADYYLAATSGETAAKRVLKTAELKASDPKLSADEKAKLLERAETRAALYRQYAGILMAGSKFEVECAKLVSGKIVDIDLSTEAGKALAGKEFFYNGAYVVPRVAFQGFRAKNVDAKSGATAYLQNCLFVAKGEKLAGGGGPSNSEVFGGFSDFDPTGLEPQAGDEFAGAANPDAGKPGADVIDEF